MLDKLVDEAIVKINRYEAKTFSVSSKLPRKSIFREEEFISRFNIYPRVNLKSALNNESARKIVEKTGLKNNQSKFDVKVLFDYEKGKVKVEGVSLFIKGRYLKLKRGVSQSEGYRYRLRNTGEKPGYSLEELIRKPLIRLTMAAKAKFHGMGREDIDVRMLGNGRPFVIELIDPKRRFIDLKEAELLVNSNGKGKVKVIGFDFSSKSEVQMLKALSPKMKKTYLAKVQIKHEIKEEDLKKLEDEFRNRIIHQRTPLRVLGRRPDRVRIKKVYELNAKKISGEEIRLIIKCDGGLYIKELISGDEGRTSPSVGGVLGLKAICRELDVIHVSDPGLFGGESHG